MSQKKTVILSIMLLMAGHVYGGRKCQNPVIRYVSKKPLGPSKELEAHGPNARLDASVMFASGFYEEAIDQLDEVLLLESNEIDMLVLRGLAKVFLGREAEAIEDLQKAVSIDRERTYEHFARVLEGTMALGHRSEREIIRIHQKFAQFIWKENIHRIF